MRFCITSQGKTLDSLVELHFGRSHYFIIYDTETSHFEVIENPNAEAESGVGIRSAQLMADKKVSAVLTGKVGPKAFQTLEAAGIEFITIAPGRVKEAIDQYQNKQDGCKKNNEESITVTDESAVSQQDVLSESWMGKYCKKIFGCRGFGFGGGMGSGQSRGKQGFVDSVDYCVCPKCGEKIAHQPGIPCRSISCEKCGVTMIRE